MTNCAKCGAELIGSRKFCATCGSPAVDPATLKRDPSGSPSPGGVRQFDPHQGVNPFAATASPSAPIAPAPYGPPPAPIVITSAKPASIPPPPSRPDVSPLAVSSALSQRNAFQQVLAEAAGAAPAVSQASVDTGAKSRIPGTQLMPSIPNPPAFGPSSVVGSAPSAAPNRQGRTQVMAMPPSAISPSAPTPPAAPPASGPAAPAAPVSPATPAMGAPSVPGGALPPAAPQGTVQGLGGPQAPAASTPAYGGYAMPQPAPAAAAGWGFYPPGQQHPPAQPAPGYPYGFGYAPGARVQVTWSNGQRYPATVHQVSGSQVLVVFPDGQQHWVDMQYLAPA